MTDLQIQPGDRHAAKCPYGRLVSSGVGPGGHKNYYLHKPFGCERIYETRQGRHRDGDNYGVLLRIPRLSRTSWQNQRESDDAKHAMPANTFP